jgi:NitT/TauT family transport system substrate-binding protein
VSTSRATISRARLFALGAAAFAAFPARARAQSVPVIRVGAVPSDLYAQPFYMDAAGLTKTYGFTLDITTFNSNAQVGTAIVGGALDVGVADLLMITNGYNRGVPFTILAAGGEYSPHNPNLFICTAKSSPFKKAADLNGLTVGVPTLVSSVAFTTTKAWFAQNGADLEKLKFVEVPLPTMAASLERGTIAAGLIPEPFLSQVPADIKLFADPYTVIGKPFLTSEWFTSRDWTAKNPDLAKRLVRAVYDSAKWANAHRDLSGRLLAKYANIDPDKVGAMRRTVYATQFNTQMLDPVLDLALRYQTIEKAVSASDLVLHGVDLSSRGQ